MQVGARSANGDIVRGPVVRVRTPDPDWNPDDELIEVTPQSIRLRKRLLSANDRKKLSRELKRERATV